MRRRSGRAEESADRHLGPPTGSFEPISTPLLVRQSASLRATGVQTALVQHHSRRREAASLRPLVLWSSQAKSEWKLGLGGGNVQP
jgi:hypothetical protein